MSIELEQGAVLPRPATAGRVSPEILKEIHEDTPMRIDNGWTRAARVGGRCWFASPLFAARQPGKVEAPDMRRVSSYQRLLLPAHISYCIKNAQEVSQFQDSTYFGKADLSKGYSQLR